MTTPSLYNLIAICFAGKQYQNYYIGFCMKING